MFMLTAFSSTLIKAFNEVPVLAQAPLHSAPSLLSPAHAARPLLWHPDFLPDPLLPLPPTSLPARTAAAARSRAEQKEQHRTGTETEPHSSATYMSFAFIISLPHTSHQTEPRRSPATVKVAHFYKS